MTAAERLTATDRLQRQLEADILTGALVPGERIKPAALAPRYGVSVTPFREALARLQSRGLVEADPFVGSRVATVSSAEARDLFGTRLRLEADALVRTMRAAGPGWGDEINAILVRLDAASEPTDTSEDTAARILRWLPVHREFHWALVVGCGSPWTLRLLRDLYDHLDRYQALAWTDQGLLRTPSLGEHYAIAAAALGGTEADAVATLEVHIASAVSWTVGAVDALLARQAVAP